MPDASRELRIGNKDSSTTLVYGSADWILPSMSFMIMNMLILNPE